MHYAPLAELYEKLSTVSSKLAKTDLLATFLQETSTVELPRVVRLLQGTVFPSWEAAELGIASHVMVKIIASTTGFTETQVVAQFRKSGDYGSVIEELIKKKKQATLFRKTLTIEQVTTNIQKLVVVEGKGSQERKSQLVSELISTATPREAKYLVRTVLGDLRVGVAEGMIRDAIVNAFFAEILWPGKEPKDKHLVSLLTKERNKHVLIDADVLAVLVTKKRITEREVETFKKHNHVTKKKIELADLWNANRGQDYVLIADAAIGSNLKKQLSDVVERAWFLQPDYGEVARLAKEEGIAGLQHVSLEVGKPYHVLLSEKAPSLKSALQSYKHPALEFKYDGVRCISGDTPLFVKDRGLVSAKYVTVGDFVLTHTGRYKKIMKKNRRYIDKAERVFEFQTFLGNQFRITEKHRILVSVKGAICWLPIEFVPRDAEVVFPVPRFPVKRLSKKISLKTIDGYRKEFILNKNFFRFLGFWIGDGYTNTTNKTYRIDLMFNRKTEKELCQYYKKIITNDFGITRISESPLRGALCLYWTDRPFLLWLSKNFRNRRKTGWRGKTLPSWFWNISKEHFLSFLQGWKEADGHTDKLGRTSIITKESNLATFAQLIGLRFGIVMGVRRITVSGGTYFKLIIPKNKKHAKIIKDKLFVKILRKRELRRHNPREIDPRARVFNFKVEGDESYCSNFVSLHNCSIHKDGKKIWLFTRRLENVTKQFPEVVSWAREGITAKKAIVEGEMLGFRKNIPMPFQFLSQRIKRKYDIEKIAKEIPVQVNLFDVVYLEGKNLFMTSLQERWATLKRIIRPIPGKFQLSKHLETTDLKRATAFYKEALQAHQEGLIVKNLEAHYQPGRRVGFWLKVKPTMENLDLVIIGATWGMGKRTGWLGSYVLGVRDTETGRFLECGMIGTGIKEKAAVEGVTFQELTKLLTPLIQKEAGNRVVIKPDVVVEVAYEEIQKSPTYTSGYALRFPRVVRIRTDKDVHTADDLNRIKKMYDLQKGGSR
ncbi:MAG: ATP-dependent DNA ligase [Nanoarchaeota archaeon]|nr:ATP-dependent DNA ligase [Nanoarchaeota archaeon]